MIQSSPPLKVGTLVRASIRNDYWMPAFAGMTGHI
jgi:hypothetical protein